MTSATAVATALFLSSLSFVANADGGDSGYARPDVSSTETGDGKGDKDASFSFFGSGDRDDDTKPAKAVDAYRHGSIDSIAWDVMRQKTLSLLRTNGHGLVADKTLINYVQNIMNRVVEASPEPSMIVKVTIRASKSFHAEAYPGGLVSVPIGLLRDLDTEDELAFVLAHEFAHVLLRHHESDWLKNAQYKTFVALSYADDLAEQVEKYTGKTSVHKKLDRGTKASRGLYEVTDHALNPAWNRKQENEADLLGFDLLVRAGYKPTAALIFFKKLGDQEEKQKNEALAARQAQAAEAEKDVRAAVEERNFFSALTSAIGQSVSQIGAEAKGAFGGTHDPAPKRLEALNAYKQKVYLDTKDSFYKKLRFAKKTDLDWVGWREARAKESNGWFLRSFMLADEAAEMLAGDQAKAAAVVLSDAIYDRNWNQPYHRLAFFNIRIALEQESRAWKNLELAMKGAEASLPVFKAAIDYQLVKGDENAVLSLIDKARQRFDDPVSLWPLRIRVLGRFGEDKAMKSLLLECRSESAELYKLCKKAAEAAQATEG